MAVDVGVSAGFLTSSPSADPGGTNIGIDAESWGVKDVAPDNGTVTEIGWYCDNATEESNYEVAIYSHDGVNDKPLDIIGSDTTNAKGTGAGWKKVTGLNISITNGTTYWICVQVDNTATTTNANYSTDTGERMVRLSSPAQTALPDPWSGGTGFNNNSIAIYAVYTTGGGGGTNIQVNVGDTWKDVAAMKVNVGDTWKDVAGAQVNVGDTWKTIF